MQNFRGVFVLRFDILPHLNAHAFSGGFQLSRLVGSQLIAKDNVSAD